MNLMRPLAFAFSLSLLAACGDDPATSDTRDATATPDGSPDATPDSTPDGSPDATPDGTSLPDATPDTTSPNSASVAITAAAGGTVTLGAATLTIPANALAADTTITVASETPGAGLPNASSLHGLTYDFGPDGTTFLVPVELALPIAGTPGAGETAVISWLDSDSGAWVDVASTVSGGMVKAEVEHFTVFVVRFATVEGDDCGFTPCGAEGIVGSWEIDGLCTDQVLDNPFGSIPDCATSVFEIVADAEGDITFKDDQTYSFTFAFAGTINVELNGACVAALGGMTCAALGEQLSGDELSATCSDASGGGCTCSGTGLGNEDAGSGTWSVSGSDLTLSETGEVPETSKICITGDTAKVQSTDVDEEDGSITKSTLSFLRK